MARMSHDDPASAASPAPAPAPVPARPSPSRAAAPSRGGSVALALLLALLALVGVGYVGWRQWQQSQGGAADSRNLAALQARVGTLENTLQSVEGERAALRQRLGDADQVNRSLREELLGQSERLRNLEDAVAKLAEKSLSGHDAMLLDETEALLRMGQQRYELFHDAEGAAAAYALADQSLAAVNDGAFSGLRQSLNAEREALASRQNRTLSATLAAVQKLRAGLAALPPKPLDLPAAGKDDGAWARLRHALASVVSVQRDDGAPLAVADARLTRQLVALDLAQAQADLLGHDEADAAAALRRADAGLAAQFDGADAGVQQARAQLAALLDGLRPAPPVQLGGALAELRNLRAVHALKPDSAPAPAASAGARP